MTTDKLVKAILEEGDIPVNYCPECKGIGRDENAGFYCSTCKGRGVLSD